MSKSRLEKFLYALYSLDSSDLPTPLSRIEELYSCLVTGEEAPIFEPLSRVEKYLMAILGGYDVDSLPNPLSRVEVLLYKLATGDDNLDNIDSFLSEHEELLAEIIRNGGVGGNIDIEYVLYTLSTEFNTLYNTAEKPVKSAVLKGQTLVNSILNQSKHSCVIKGNSSNGGNYSLEQSDVLFSKNTNYTFFYTVENCTTNNNIVIFTSSAVSVASAVSLDKTLGRHCVSFTTKNEELTHNYSFYIHSAGDDSTIDETNQIVLKDLVIVKGDYTNQIIPYFEGMQSVKMPVLTTVGKNICNLFNYYLRIGWGDVKASIKTVTNQSLTFRTNTANDWIGVGYELEPNKKYSVTMKVTCNSSNAPESYRVYRSSTSLP